MNNSWQRRVSALPWHSSQVLKQSSGAFQNWTLKKSTFTGEKKRKKKESQLPPRLYVFAEVQHLKETSLHGLHLLIGNLSFRLKTKQAGIVVLSSLITSQENSRAGKRGKQIMVKAVIWVLKTLIFLLKEHLQFPRPYTRLLTAA